ncbi:MAG TPA: RNA polymerase factor sigma-54 [Fimbriimonadaceae bacterium]
MRFLRQGFQQTQRLETGLRVDPRLVLSSQILQLTQMELDQAIETELSDNPALERLQDDVDPIHEETILKSVAPHELKPGSEDFEFYRSLPNDESDKPDWTDLTASHTSLWDSLKAQLLPSLEPHLRDLGDYVVDCINDRGYLQTPVEEIALNTGCSMDDVETVVRALRNCEPAGVGATTVEECLLLQLREQDTVETKLARAILKNHLDDFLSRRSDRIMRRYRVLPEVVEKAFAEILGLSPYPGEAFSVGSHSRNSSAKSVGIIPDLVLMLTESGWTVEPKGADPGSLGIDRTYRKRFQELNQSDRAPKDEKRHVSEYVQRASDFIQSIHQRRRTIKEIGNYLVQNQSGFVSTGRYQFLKPLTRTQMAKDLGMHESTVSRATMGKFVQIANGETVSFEVFFKPALRIQKMIQEILETENPKTPLSDEQIAELLKERGVYVARRTVNKYRDKNKLLSSRKRRSA